MAVQPACRAWVELRRSLREIHDTRGLTAVFVTRDQKEARERNELVGVPTLTRAGREITICDHKCAHSGRAGLLSGPRA